MKIEIGSEKFINCGSYGYHIDGYSEKCVNKYVCIRDGVFELEEIIDTSNMVLTPNMEIHNIFPWKYDAVHVFPEGKYTALQICKDYSWYIHTLNKSDTPPHEDVKIVGFGFYNTTSMKPLCITGKKVDFHGIPAYIYPKGSLTTAYAVEVKPNRWESIEGPWCGDVEKMLDIYNTRLKIAFMFKSDNNFKKFREGI